MADTVFYSWQSDLPNNTNRGFIQAALEAATKTICDDESIQVEPIMDRDTVGVAGTSAWLNLGTALHERKDYPAAIDVFKKALALDPKDAGDPAKLAQRLASSQKGKDLSTVRDAEELAKLPEMERQAWQKLWAEVDQLLKEARGLFTETSLTGTLTAKAREQAHELKMTAGKTYVIDLSSRQFNTYLRLEDEKGKTLAENDDIDTKANNLNSRLEFAPPRDGTYRIIATSFEQRGRGAYEIVVREFAGKEK